MGYLQKFALALREFLTRPIAAFHRTSPNATPAVAENAPLARYLTTKAYFNTTRVLPAAFLPNPQNGTTSVYIVDGLDRDAVQSLGNEQIRGRSVYGHAGITVDKVTQQGLSVQKNGPPRHADIGAWPDTKAARLLIAMKLAADAQLNRY